MQQQHVADNIDYSDDKPDPSFPTPDSAADDDDTPSDSKAERLRNVIDILGASIAIDNTRA